jgi:ribosomal protein S18 acetylase RimI-like enzyme
MYVTIRPVVPADVDQLVDIALRAWAPVHASMAAVLGPRLNRQVYPDWAASQAADVRQACADREVSVFVAAGGSAMVGFVCLAVDACGGSGEIDMIAVDPPAQRQGVARALTEHALTYLRASGCSLAHVATGADPGHAPARALYEAAGFTPLPLVRYYRAL